MPESGSKAAEIVLQWSHAERSGPRVQGRRRQSGQPRGSRPAGPFTTSWPGSPSLPAGTRPRPPPASAGRWPPITSTAWSMTACSRCRSPGGRAGLVRVRAGRPSLPAGLPGVHVSLPPRNYELAGRIFADAVDRDPTGRAKAALQESARGFGAKSPPRSAPGRRRQRRPSIGCAETGSGRTGLRALQ